MAKLTADRHTREGQGDTREFLVAATEVIFAGSVVEMDATGHAIAATAGVSQNYVGVNNERAVDNSAGADGDKTVRVMRGEFGLNIDGGDPVTVADVGSTVYLVDDNTIGATDAGATLSPLGVLFDVRDGQAYVTIVGK